MVEKGDDELFSVFRGKDADAILQLYKQALCEGYPSPTKSEIGTSIVPPAKKPFVKTEDEGEPKLKQFAVNIVAMAEEHQKRVEDMTEQEAAGYIKGIVDSNDVVFGVWIDPEHPNGTGTVEIKSDPRFKEPGSNELIKLKVSGVRCTREQALAVQQGVPVVPVVFELLPARRMSRPEKARLESETLRTVEMYFAERPIFAVLAGAVFALHQHTLRAYAVDLRNLDVNLGATIDKIRPSTLGNFPKRVRLTVDALHQIDDFNLDQRDKYNQVPPSGTDAKEYQFQELLAAMRFTAARIWLLTIYSKIKKGEGSNASLLKIWSRLQTLPAADLHEEAKFFTGTFYNNVRSEPLDLTMWTPNSAM